MRVRRRVHGGHGQVHGAIAGGQVDGTDPAPADSRVLMNPNRNFVEIRKARSELWTNNGSIDQVRSVWRSKTPSIVTESDIHDPAKITERQENETNRDAVGGGRCARSAPSRRPTSGGGP